MEFVLVAFVALFTSLLTFFSGFGLGTLLLPVFLLFFPVEIAIAMTAIVHFLNNLFKTGLIGGHAKWRIVVIFGIPAFFAAIGGATALNYLAEFPIHIQYKVFGFPVSTSLVEVVIGMLLLIFAIFEIVPARKSRKPHEWLLIIGGLLSGFFGGLSGHQGALRSAFLIRMGLSKEAFVATGILISLFIDVSRLGTYWTNLPITELYEHIPILLTAILSAFAGAILGRKLLNKVTIRVLQYFVAVGISIVGLLLMVGVL